jgi:cytochrome c oxidase cbb3-type subunit 1
MSLSPLHRNFTSSDPELAAVDASVRWPVIVGLLAAVHWMVVGTVLMVYASSLKHPSDSAPILDVFTWLSEHLDVFTFGRVYPAGVDALLYGWCGSAAMGLVMWVLARLGRTPVRSPAALMTAVVFWNLGVGVGLTAILMGQSTGVELLEFPAYAAAILWCAFALFAYWSILDYLGRKSDAEHIGQGWILAALFAFPWLYACGSMLLGHQLPGSGVVQGMIQAWYVHGVYTLWLAPVGLGVLYYLVPKCSGLSLRYASRARLAFWTWIIFAPWTAVHDMVGGPFPEATVSIGLALSGLLFLPVALIGLSLQTTVHDGYVKYHESVVLPFFNSAVMFFIVAGIVEEVLSVRGLNVLLHFTMFREANTFLWVYGFFSFIIFGAFYYILPRLLNFGWRSTLLIKAHYYAIVYGVILVITMYAFGGVMQGLTLENPDPQATIVTADLVALSFQIGITLCLCVISIGNGIFAYHLGWTFLEYVRGGPRSVGLHDQPGVPSMHEAALDPGAVEQAHA